jgi:hypothetical protein
VYLVSVTAADILPAGRGLVWFASGPACVKILARNKRIERAAQVNLRCVPGRILALMLHQIPVENRFRTAWVIIRIRPFGHYVSSGQLRT